MSGFFVCNVNQSNANTDVQIETDAAEVTEINASMINGINDFDDQYLPDPTESKNTKSIYVLNNATIDMPM